MDQAAQDFLSATASAAMITVSEDGTAHAVRCGIALVDGKLWSSAVPERVRTPRIRRDPRATLFVYNVKEPYKYLTLECSVKIIEGLEAPGLSLNLFRVMQNNRDGSKPMMWNGQPLSDEDFLKAMVDEERLIFEFDVVTSYGIY